MANKVDCNICCESVTQLNIVKCGYCDEETCQSCSKRYLLDSIQDPHCMSCRRVWDRHFLIEHFAKTWIDKDLKTHRENILFDRERAMLPATQPAVDREIGKREVQTQLTALKAQKIKLKNDLKNTEQTIWDLERAYYRGETFSKTEDKASFTRKCQSENCKGFLNAKMKCGICESVTCKDCNEIVTGDDHECDPEAVETMKLLKKDTKPCPSCGTMISKVSGCDQMWCPSCQNAFSWRTGRLERGVIHNPHYYEFMKNTGHQHRNHGDFECGGMPRPMVGLWGIEGLVSLRNMYRSLTHIQAVELQRFRIDPTANNERFRILYMLNEMNDAEFKTKIQRKEKERQKFTDIYDIFQMVHTTGSMYMRELAEIDSKVVPPARRMFALAAIISKEKVPERVYEIMEEMENLRTYANKALSDASKRYSKCKVPIITENWLDVTK